MVFLLYLRVISVGAVPQLAALLCNITAWSDLVSHHLYLLVSSTMAQCFPGCPRPAQDTKYLHLSPHQAPYKPGHGAVPVTSVIFLRVKNIINRGRSLLFELHYIIAFKGIDIDYLIYI